jgi:predicted AAA+ superfamily ATPase
MACVDDLEEAFSLFRVQRYSPRVKEQMKSRQKICGFDTGLINAVKFRGKVPGKRYLGKRYRTPLKL